MKYVESLNQALHRLLDKDSRVLLLGEDVLDPYGGAFKVSKGLSTAFPDRVFTMPISEAAIVGMGTGLAMRGMRPVVEIMFGDFILLAADQIVNSATKFPLMFNSKISVPLVIRVPMGGRRGYGPTHSQTLETFFMNTPNLDIIAPSHLHDPGQLLENAVLASDGVTLFVENKSLYAQELMDINQPHAIFEFQKLGGSEDLLYPTIKVSIRDVEKQDIVLIAYGGMSPFVLQAAEKAFFEEEIAVTCLLVSQVKPLPMGTLRRVCASVGKVLIVEESLKYGGWGAELSAQLHQSQAKNSPIHIRRIGASEFVIPSSKELEEKMLPQVQDIYQATKDLFNEC